MNNISILQIIWQPVLLSRCLLVLLSAAISACGFIEIKPAYETNSASLSSEQARTPAPVTFHNKPQVSAPTASNASSTIDSSGSNGTASTTALVQTAALTPISAVIEEAELSEFSEVANETDATPMLASTAEAPLIAAASIELAQIATPVIAEPAVVAVAEEVTAGVIASATEANLSAESDSEPEQQLVTKTATATITPNILVESQIPELTVEQPNVPEVNATTASTELEANLSDPVTSHTVAEGETVYSIATKYGVSVEQLAQLNSISPPNYLIYPEMILKIRDSAVAAPNVEQYIEHKVKEGETVYSIALLYQMTPEELAQLNDIAIPGYLIYPEMALQVRGLESNSSSAESDSNDSTSNTILDLSNWQWPLDNFAQISDSGNQDLPGVLITASSRDIVRAAGSGEVIVAGELIRPISLMVLIAHDDGYVSTYGHMQELTVNEGDEVRAGQTLGRLDNSGKLYFETRKGSTSVDARKFLQ